MQLYELRKIWVSGKGLSFQTCMQDRIVVAVLSANFMQMAGSFESCKLMHGLSASSINSFASLMSRSFPLDGDSLENGQLRSLEGKQLPSESCKPLLPCLFRDSKHGFLDKMTCRQGRGV